jgi:hypothetical protein
MKRLLSMLVVAAPALLGCPTESAQKRMEDKIASAQKTLEKAKTDRRAKEEAAMAPAPVAPVVLDTYWDSPEYTALISDAPCPPDFWALFPGEAPGANKEEKKANNAKRAPLAKALREKTYVVKLKGPAQVTLQPFDPPTGHFPLEVLGTIDCTDAFGHVAIAWSAAKAITPGNSAAKQDADVTQRIWQADPLKYALPMKSMVEAKDYADKYKGGFSARIVVKLGKVDVDKKVIKTEKVTDKDITIGGGMEDWGAGRLMRTELQGIRIAVDREKTPVLEKKGL